MAAGVVESSISGGSGRNPGTVEAERNPLGQLDGGNRIGCDVGGRQDDEVAAVLSEEDRAEEARAEAAASQPSPLPSLSGASNDELDIGTDTSYELSEADFTDALSDQPTSPLSHRSDVEE